MNNPKKQLLEQLENSLYSYQDKIDNYIDIPNTLKHFIEVLEENITDIEKNKCIDCGIDIGRYNPRQLCGKLYCINKAILN